MEIKWGAEYTIVRNLDKHGLVETVEKHAAGGWVRAHRLPDHRGRAGGGRRLGA